MGRKSKFSPEVRERATRLVMETRESHDSEWAAITSVSAKIGCRAETLRKWVRRAERDASVGSEGDSYDNALAETINGLFKTEVIRHLGPWKNLEAVELAVLEWVEWWDNRRILGPIGYVSPREFERHTMRARSNRPWWSASTEQVSGIPGGIHSAGAAPSRSRIHNQSIGSLAAGNFLSGNYTTEQIANHVQFIMYDSQLYHGN